MNEDLSRLPVSYGNFLHSILGLYLRRRLADALEIPERDVYVWPVRAYCFQAIAFEYVEIDGISICNVIDNPSPRLQAEHDER